MSPSPADYLRHIVDEADYLMRRSRQLTKEEFLQDETLKRAFVRSLEIMGEAAKKVPEDIRKEHPHVAWKEIAGMRDRLIHGYFGIDYDIVWDAVVNKVPVFCKEVERIIEMMSKGRV